MDLCEDSSDEDVKPNFNKDSTPSISWNDLFLKEELRRVIRESKFDRPSQVQM